MPEVDGRPAPVREALDVAREYGLPTEVYGMFHPSSHGGAFSPVSTGNVAAGPFWRLGRHEAQLGDSYVSEYALDEKGRVVLLDPSGPEPRFVDSSLIAFLAALAAWDHRNEHLDDFDHLEPEDDEDEDDPAEAARIAFGMEIARKLAEHRVDRGRDVPSASLSRTCRRELHRALRGRSARADRLSGHHSRLMAASSRRTARPSAGRVRARACTWVTVECPNRWVWWAVCSRWGRRGPFSGRGCCWAAVPAGCRSQGFRDGFVRSARRPDRR
ncbi:SUKH-4 family immunity protein [Streptomyces sp. NPDC007883]|uniref:SUKH-4 family immunity protein n=1 Tax=Streptomyces sp. NPDC007883 TaxID=3155116 RepID=UPI00340A1CE1